MSTSRSVVSDSSLPRNRKLNLESRSLRSRSTFISPSPGPLSNPATPHSLRRPPEAMPNPAAMIQSMDDASETNSIHSEVSQTSQDILIPAPPMSDYGKFIEWLIYHFPTFISSEFELFLLEKMQLLSIQELHDFVTTCAPKTLHSSIGTALYDEFRKAIIDLKIIWAFLHQAYNKGEITGSYNSFLSLREQMVVRTNILFPPSEIYTRPTPAYRPVSSVVRNQSENISLHLTGKPGYYSANVTPDSATTAPENGSQKLTPSSSAASSP